LLLTVTACRDYDFRSNLIDDDGLLPAEQYARYGREQAQAIGIAREFAQAHEGADSGQLIQQARKAAEYARTLPDVVDVKADPLGQVLTLQFRSGWRTMVTPLDDGKRGAETAGLPARSGAPGSSRWGDTIPPIPEHTAFCQVTTTLPDQAAAERMAATLVQERLAACAQVTGPVSSTYRWQSSVDHAAECYCHLKTTVARLPAVRARIRELHPYDVPEVIALPIIGGDSDYLRWIEESVS
jgi:periplasmic divalent cation tolerance protein